MTEAPSRDGLSDSAQSRSLLSGTSRAEFAMALVHCYVFLLAFGILQRPFGNPFGFGISSVVSVAIIAVVLPEALRVIRAHRLVQLWLFLIGYVLVITTITRPDLPVSDPGYMRIASLLLCCLLCAATASLPWSEARLRGVGISMAAGLAIAGVLAVIDDAGIAAIPLMNISLVNDPPIREPVAQFGHRSVMSLYLGVMLPFLFVLEDRDQSLKLRALIVAVGVCFLYFLIYSRNRSGFGAISIAIASYYAFNLKNRNRWLHSRVPGFLLVIVLAFVIVFWFRPWQGATFLMLWFNSPFFANMQLFGISVKDISDISVHGMSIADLADLKMNPFQTQNLNDSDMLRVKIIEDTFASLPDHLAGRGFMANTHVHFLIDIIHAAGVIGIAWLIAFAGYLGQMLRSISLSGRDGTALWLVLTPLISWFWVGLMFNAVNIGLGWVYFGMLMAVHQAVRTR